MRRSRWSRFGFIKRWKSESRRQKLDLPSETSEANSAAITSARFFIECEGLVKIYKVADLETVALQGLDLQVRKGEVLAVVGNSGSGKTTLLNVLGGLDRPSAGRVYVGGQNLLELSDSALSLYRREKVGFVWQQSSRNLIPYLSALENVQVPMVLMGRAGSSRLGRAKELLAAVGLESRACHRPAQLSGGEQQRVAIAVAMANSPEILLADEPTGEVDSEAAVAIYSTFRRMSQVFGTTVILVSHDRLIADYVDRVVAVRDGKVSTETMRRESEHGILKDGDKLEELVVLDSAGRLQIPRDLVEVFKLKNRVRVEAADGHIVIIPVADD